MQYLTIGRKSQAIIKVIELNLDLAEEETNYRKQMKYLEEVISALQRKSGVLYHIWAQA